MKDANQNNSNSKKSPGGAPIELGTGSTNRLKDLVMQILPEGGYLNSCYNCGICASGCPASGIEGMDPRKFIRMLSLGMDKELIANNWVWVCTTCNRCVYVCPMKIDIPQLVFIVRSSWPEAKRPKKMVDYCRHALKNDTNSPLSLNISEWHFIVEDVADDIKATQGGFEELTVHMDKKNVDFFLNQDARTPLKEPEEMGPVLKILHLAGADWTYGSTGWAADNFCMSVADSSAWKKLVEKKVDTIENLGCKVLLNTESGHDYLAIRQGLEKFAIPHSFEVKSIIEYYAHWIRQGKLKVNSDWNRNLKIKFTVQDPCQLVRNGDGDFIADELRFVVTEAVGEENFIDMYPSRSNNYCCGGGNGAVQSSFNKERLLYGKVKLEQILKTGAAYCITPCCNCHSQITDLSNHYNADFRTVHLFTILCLAMNVLGENERKYLGDDLARIGLTDTD